MARKLVSYEDMIAEAGPSDLAKYHAQADHHSDEIDIDDDEVAPLPSGVKKPPPKDGKLSVSARKRLRKKRKLEERQKAQSGQRLAQMDTPSQKQQQQQQQSARTTAPAPAEEVQTDQVSSHQQDEQQINGTDFQNGSGQQDQYYQYDEDHDDNYADEEDYQNEESYEDQDYDEDHDFVLNTNIIIPDIPAHFRTDTSNASLQRNPRLPETVPATPDVPDPTGRVLHDDEICSDSAIVDAWSAACLSLFKPTQKSKGSPSALWDFAPLPGSSSDKKMKQTAEMNREKRRLQKFVQDQQQQQQQQHQQQQTKAGLSGQAGPVAGKEAATKTDFAEAQQASSTKKPGAQPQRAAPGTGRPASASPSMFKLNRVIPPSIGLQGNAAWQAACAKVASTKNRIGPPVLSCTQTNAKPQSSLTGSSSPPTSQIKHTLHNPSLPPLPVNAGVEQETLHHICTSWYQAGYYTGLLQAQTTRGQQRDGPNAATQTEDTSRPL